MKTLRIVVRHIMFACCVVFMFFMSKKIFMMSMVPHSVQTFIDMLHIADNMRQDMNASGCSNVIEYADSLTSARGVPRVIECEGVRKRFENSGLPTLFIFGGTNDAWGQPLLVSLMANPQGAADMRIHSSGKNKQSENGNGDDIVVWLNAVDYNKASIASQEKRWVDGEAFGTAALAVHMLICLYLAKTILTAARRWGGQKNAAKK